MVMLGRRDLMAFLEERVYQALQAHLERMEPRSVQFSSGERKNTYIYVARASLERKDLVDQ